MGVLVQGEFVIGTQPMMNKDVFPIERKICVIGGVGHQDHRRPCLCVIHSLDIAGLPELWERLMDLFENGLSQYFPEPLIGFFGGPVHLLENMVCIQTDQEVGVF